MSFERLAQVLGVIHLALDELSGASEITHERLVLWAEEFGWRLTQRVTNAEIELVLSKSLSELIASRDARCLES
ncbi:MAG: hypothetical protein IPO08_22540 [Xanthomonadales bacterium]|nr:hypothetical protein [Xanthomonadales bacterium]